MNPDYGYNGIYKGDRVFSKQLIMPRVLKQP